MVGVVGFGNGFVSGGGGNRAPGGEVGHNATMNDVLTYLETHRASFAEEPFNAVDSALLAQFCMARGEGVMPHLAALTAVGEEGGEVPRGRHRLVALLDRLRHRGRGPRGRGGAAGTAAAAVPGTGADAAQVAAGAGDAARVASQAAQTGGTANAGGAAAGGAAAGDGVIVGDGAAVLAPAPSATKAEALDRVEDAQDAGAPTKPVRFADLLRAELFPTMFSGMHATSMIQQLFWMAASPRFRELLIYDHEAAFDEALDMQFAATTFVCPGQFAYVGYRGTDTTLTGWREDFNMAYMVPVPAQDLAVRYLEAVAADRRLPERLIVGGHSKGGNLAEYAALKASPAVQGRIARLYNHDGPGFMPGTFTAADYEPLAGRMTKQVPEDSMVGILMESLMPTEVVRATGRGFEQHTVYRWVVAEGGVDFATVGALPERTERRAEALAAWLASMDGEDRERMVNALFSALKAAGITDAAQLFAGGREWAILRDGVMRAPMADRTTMLNALRGLTRAFSDVTAARNNARRASKK